MTLLLGCTGGSIQQLQKKPDGPASEGTIINLRYIDSGKVKAHLKAPFLKDFSNEEFPYREFPDGLDLTFIDDKKEENYITADYGIQYTLTGLVDLRQNVVLITKDNDTLKAQQLYWDQAKSWVFTDLPYTLISADGSQNKGDLFDSSEDFTDFVSLNNTSRQYVKEEEEESNITNDSIR